MTAVGLTIDGRQVAAADSGQIRTVELDAGFHDLQIDYRQIRGDSALYAQWSPTGELPRPFDGETLFPHEPSSVAVSHQSLAPAPAETGILCLGPAGRGPDRAGCVSLDLSSPSTNHLQRERPGLAVGGASSP